MQVLVWHGTKHIAGSNR